jgi:hypothetical protein
MAKKSINLCGMVDADHAAINLDGFTSLERAVSRSKAHRLAKKLKKLNCDPAVDVKGQKAIGSKFQEKHGKYGNPRQIKRLEDAGMPWVSVGSMHGYCVESCFWWYENVYYPSVCKIKCENLKSSFYTDQS